MTLLFYCKKYIELKGKVMHIIYSRSINIFTVLILIFGLFSTGVVANDTVNYSISDTVYLEGNGLVNVDVNNYLNAFQLLNSEISSIESISETSFDCNHSIEVIQIRLLNGVDTLFGELNTTVLDTISPWLNLNDNTTLYLNEDGLIDDLWPSINNGSKDNCSYEVSLNPSELNCQTLGLQQVTVTMIDPSGNEVLDSVSVNIVDNISPTIVLNEVVAYLDDLGEATISINDLEGGSYDNCDNDFNLTLSDSVFTYADVGVNTVIYSISNSLGESVSINASIEVRDTVAPFINSQDLTLYLDNDGELVVTASMFNNGTTDNSLIYTLDISDAFFTCNDLGVNNLDLVATDNYNNTSVASVQLTVKDHFDPVAITEDIILVLDESGQATLDPDEFDNGSYDNCSITKTVSEKDFDCSDIGSHAVFLNVTDISGNFNTAIGNVTIVDNTAPVAITQVYELELDIDGLGTISAMDLDNGSYDNCSTIDDYTISQTNFDCTDLGSQSIIFGVSDIYGNLSTVLTTVNTIDLLPPTINLQDFTAELDSNGNYFLNEDDINVGTIDNCSDDLIFTYSDTVLTASDLGENTITVYVSDESGNSASQDIIITVEDHLIPQLNISIPDQLAYSESSFCGAFVTFPSPSFEDNSGEFTVTYSHVNGTFFGLGNSMVYYTATDGSGNSTVDSFEVSVLDITPPVVINPITNYTYNGEGVVVWDVDQMVFSDNCSDNYTITLSHHSLDTFEIGTTVVSGTVADEYGNITTFVFDIVVEDIVNPIIVSMPEDIQIYLAESDGCEVLVEYEEVIASDNHSSTEITYSFESGNSLEVGQHTVTVEVNDESGNVISSDFSIEIIDTVSPVFTYIPDDIFVGLCDNNVTYQDPVVQDNCTIASLLRTSGLASGSIFPEGIHQIVYLATDIYGNSSEINFEINIHQIDPPNVHSVKIGCTEFEPFNLTDEDENIMFFGQGIESNKFNPEIVESGIYTISWRWEDYLGCETNGTMEVIINDTPPQPEIFQPNMFQLSVHNAYNDYQWYKNGEIIEGATYKDLEIFDGGNYEVIVGNESNCTSQSQVYNIGGGIFPSLNIDDLKEHEVAIYPNPTQDFIIITSKEMITQNSFELYNVIGQKHIVSQIQFINPNQAKIELGHFEPGVYEILLHTTSGLRTKKIIIN